MRYTKEVKEKAFGYFCKGLNSKEIAKLMDLNFRSIQEFMQNEDWKKARDEIREKEEKRIIRKYRKMERQKAAKKAENKEKQTPDLLGYK